VYLYTSSKPSKEKIEQTILHFKFQKALENKVGGTGDQPAIVSHSSRWTAAITITS